MKRAIIAMHNAGARLREAHVELVDASRPDLAEQIREANRLVTDAIGKLITGRVEPRKVAS